MTTNTFSDLNLAQPLLQALAHEGYTHPTPIQQQAIPQVLAGRDLLATAQTGTGKTAAFALPLLQRLGAPQRQLRVLVLTPTRELALQIDASFRAYGRHLPLRSTVVLGGVPAPPQIKALRSRPDILVATPGRLLDLLNQGHVGLDHVQALVLDEADRMLDMGFIHDVKRIIEKVPDQRQSLLFSATIPAAIDSLAAGMLRDPFRVSVTPSKPVSSSIEQQVRFVAQEDKRALLTEILRDRDVQRALVFTRTKHRANRISKQLSKEGIAADAIHSNKSQNARQRALAAFDAGRTRVLVATDIMARGIDVDGISHVINYELPNEPESYVHRIGRTARAGASGVAISFCDGQEIVMLRGIEKLTRKRLLPITDHRFHAASVAALHASGARATAPGRSPGRQSASSPGTPGGGGSRRGNGRPRRAEADGNRAHRNGNTRTESPRRSYPSGNVRSQGGGFQDAQRGGLRDAQPQAPRQRSPRQSVAAVHVPLQSGGPTFARLAQSNAPVSSAEPVSGNRLPQEGTKASQPRRYGRRRRPETQR